MRKHRRPKALWCSLPGRTPAATAKVRKPLKRTRIAQVSNRQAIRLREYRKVKQSFLSKPENKWCTPCSHDAMLNGVKAVFYGVAVSEVRRATHPHHIRGVAGSLLTDERFMLATCDRHHRWIHDNPEEARNLGWLASPGDWGKQTP